MLNTESALSPPGAQHVFLGLARLMRQSVSGTVMAPLARQLIELAAHDPDEAGALMDASVILQFYGNDALARQLQGEALKVQRHYCLAPTRPARLKLLMLMAPGGIADNVPLECLLEDSDIDLHQYYLDGPDDDLSRLPEHDLLFVAPCETEANRPLLKSLEGRLAHWPRPILNAPQGIERVARDTAARLLAPLPGVLMPPTRRLGRAQLQALAAADGTQAAQALGLAFPLIVRPIDSHAGNGLHKVETPTELAAALDGFEGEAGFASSFIDYSGADGQFRKYRVMLIGGQPYAAHGATSSHWMIHYVNAGMADSAAKRAEEAEFMAGFDQGFARRHGTALRAIDQALGLDYWGLDCAETADGRLLVFEVDTAMVVHAMDPVDLYPYKQPVMQRLFAAFRALLFKTAGQATPELDPQ